MYKSKGVPSMRVKDALQLPIMNETKLVAGEQGLNNQIKWVTIVEVLEDIERIQSGEFLITTGFELLKDQTRLDTFHTLLRSSSVSGVAIYTSFYMTEIPESFIQAANENDLPLIEIPVDINFSEITRAILEQIVNRQAHVLAHSERIHSELSNLILNDQSLNEVTKRLAQLTAAQIMIYNEFYEMIYTNDDFFATDNSESTSTEHFMQTIDNHASEYLLESFKKESKDNIYYQDRIFTIYPIIAKQECFGWIVMLKRHDDWIELDDIAIERAAVVYAMEFLKKQAIEETHLRMQSNLLDDLMSGNYQNDQLIIDQALKLQYDVTLPQNVFHLTFKQSEKIDIQMIDRLYKITERLLIGKNKQHIIQAKLQSVIILAHATGNSSKDRRKQARRFAKELLQEWRYYFPKTNLLIGIGNDYDSINLLRKSAREARYAALLYKIVNKDSQIIHYNDLGMYDLLLEMHRKGINLQHIYEDSINELINDNDREIDFIETLDVYLNHNQSIQRASEQLFIHRHTLRYRLNQIEKITGLSF